MWHVLVWAPVGLGLLLWSLGCWGVHALLTGPGWSTGGVVAWGAWLEQWRIPVWLADWLPMAAITALKTWLTAVGPVLESLLAQMPALLSWLSPLVWLGWALGLGVLLLIGMAGSVLVLALRGAARAAG